MYPKYGSRIRTGSLGTFCSLLIDCTILSIQETPDYSNTRVDRIDSAGENAYYYKFVHGRKDIGNKYDKHEK